MLDRLDAATFRHHPDGQSGERMRQFAALIIGLLWPALAAAQDTQPPEVDTSGGRLVGVVMPDGSAGFRGIPYAAPAVEQGRWTAPAPPATWTGVRPAQKAGPPCAQPDLGWNSGDAARGSEDCLYLDVRTPRLEAGAGLPVMVNIHGGANVAGSGSGFLYSSIVERGVVLVTINYRLGVFGFLSHPEITSEGGAVGNFALLDQIAALEWVRENIAAFGGDPDNVTIFGHSAGAQDVSLLTLTPRARGLFRRAIAQSGTAGFGLSPRTLAENEQVGVDLAEAVGAEDLTALRATPAQVLIEAGRALHATVSDDSLIWLQAVVDGQVLPASPQALLEAGEGSDIPLIVGFSAREFGPPGDAEGAVAWVREQFGETAEEALRLYGLHDGRPVDAAMADRIAVDAMFRCPALVMARVRAEHGGRTWIYRLDVERPGSGQPVHHGSELPFVFDRAESDDPGVWPPMQAYWAAFSATGTPDADWRPWDETDTYLIFGPQGPVPASQTGADVCELFNRP